MKVARHVQSNQKRKLLNFCNILRKSIATTFVFHCDAKHSDIYWVPIIFVVTCFRVPVVKNGHGLLDHGTLKSAVTQKSELMK